MLNVWCEAEATTIVKESALLSSRSRTFKKGLVERGVTWTSDRPVQIGLIRLTVLLSRRWRKKEIRRKSKLGIPRNNRRSPRETVGYVSKLSAFSQVAALHSPTAFLFILFFVSHPTILILDLYFILSPSVACDNETVLRYFCVLAYRAGCAFRRLIRPFTWWLQRARVQYVRRVPA